MYMYQSSFSYFEAFVELKQWDYKRKFPEEISNEFHLIGWSPQIENPDYIGRFFVLAFTMYKSNDGEQVLN